MITQLRNSLNKLKSVDSNRQLELENPRKKMQAAGSGVTQRKQRCSHAPIVQMGGSQFVPGLSVSRKGDTSTRRLLPPPSPPAASPRPGSRERLITWADACRKSRVGLHAAQFAPGLHRIFFQLSSPRRRRRLGLFTFRFPPPTSPHGLLLFLASYK